MMKELFYLTQMFEGEGDTDTDTQEQDKAGAEKKYSDEDLDRIISARFAKWEKQQAKKISEAERLAKMTEEERTKAERDALQAELDQLKKENARAAMHTEARRILAGEDITVPDELVNILVADDADTTNAAVTAFASAYKDAVQEGIKAALAGKAPQRSGGRSGITKEQILSTEDPIARQKLIRENLKLFTGGK